MNENAKPPAIPGVLHCSGAKGLLPVGSRVGRSLPRHPWAAPLVAVAAFPGAGAQGTASAIGTGAVRVAACGLGRYGLLLLVVHGVVGLSCSTAQRSGPTPSLALHPHGEGLYHFV